MSRGEVVPTITVTGLWIYPVKSCRGIALNEMEIGATGALNDRRWMIVDKENQFISLRSQPQLAQIATALQGPFLHLYLGDGITSGARNKILVDTRVDCQERVEVSIWKDRFLAGVESKDVNNALSDFMSMEVKLVRYDEANPRRLGSEASTSVSSQVMFADARPLLVTNEKSLQELNARLLASGYGPTQMERFRPNIVVDGLDAFSEDSCRKISFGDVILSQPKLCSRCPVVTQNIATGKVVAKEVLKVLSDFRRIGEKNAVMFGVYFSPERLGKIRLGTQGLQTLKAVMKE